MTEYEQENVVTRDALHQLQGHMGTILEHLQDQRDNATVVNPTDATAITNVVDTALVVVYLIDTIVQPVFVSHPLYQVGPCRFSTSCPWETPHNYTLQFASGNPFVIPALRCFFFQWEFCCLPMGDTESFLHSRG